jgi:hypothetical protein
MMEQSTKAAFVSPRSATLRIQRLLATPINLIRIEFTGDDVRGLARVGSVAIYGPFVVIGYLLLVAGLARAAAMRFGWGWSLFLLGTAHILIGAVGLATGAPKAAPTVYPVVEPELVQEEDDAADRRITLVKQSSNPPAFPPRSRTSV